MTGVRGVRFTKMEITPKEKTNLGGGGGDWKERGESFSFSC